MYLNDLLDALSRGEKPDLTKPELLSIFRAQKPLFTYQHVALFYKLLGPRVEGETQIQRANRIGASKNDVKQHEGVMNWTTCKDYSQILDALCAGALLLYAGGKEQSLSTSRLYSKLRNGYRIRSITPKGNRWYIEF